MNAGSDAGLARSRRAREELAKAWLLEMLERTPLAEMSGVPIDWVIREGPALIADVLRGMAEPVPRYELELPADGIERVAALAHLRKGEAALRIPRDLASLQALLVEALRRETPERRLSAFSGSVERLATIFGDIQAQVTEEVIRERGGGASVDPLTSLAGRTQLHEWLGLLLGAHRLHGTPFSVVLIDVDGLDRVNDAYGREAGDRMLAAVAAVVRGHVGSADRAFRVDGDEFCVLVPGQRLGQVLPLAERLCELVEGSQDEGGPRVSISAGLAACPDHGASAEALLAAAEEGVWAAKAAGHGVAIGGP